MKIGDRVVLTGSGEAWERTWYLVAIEGNNFRLARGDDQTSPTVTAEQIESFTPRDVAMSPCVDCGESVPTVRTGQGWRDLPHCPASTSIHYPGHRVSNDAFVAAGGKS